VKSDPVVKVDPILKPSPNPESKLDVPDDDEEVKKEKEDDEEDEYDNLDGEDNGYPDHGKESLDQEYYEQESFY